MYPVDAKLAGQSYKLGKNCVANYVHCGSCSLWSGLFDESMGGRVGKESGVVGVQVFTLDKVICCTASTCW